MSCKNYHWSAENTKNGLTGEIEQAVYGLECERGIIDLGHCFFFNLEKSCGIFVAMITSH